MGADKGWGKLCNTGFCEASDASDPVVLTPLELICNMGKFLLVMPATFGGHISQQVNAKFGNT